MPSNPDGSEEQSLARQLYILAAAGTQFTGTIGASALLGWWLDGLVGTKPWILMVMVLVGTAGGFVVFIRALRRLSGQGRPDQT